jgi:hypothetical protein
MSIEKLHIDRGFRPEIKKFSIGVMYDYFEAFHIPSTGIPAPVLDRNKKAAIWTGEAPTSRNEVPVLAVSMDSNAEFNRELNHFYIGPACAAIAVDARQAMEQGIADDHLLADVAIRSAIYGPNNLNGAVQLLRRIMPIDSVSS